MSKTLIDSHISESIEQIQQGHFYGPFDTAEEMIEALHKDIDARRPQRHTR